MKFYMSNQKSEILHFEWFLLSKSCTVSAKKALNSDPKFKEIITFCLKNDMTNLVNFNVSSEKSENLHFGWTFLSKVCNVGAKII